MAKETGLKARLTRIRPWTRLGISRKAYETKRPWSGTGLTRDEFERVVLHMPDALLQEIRLDSDADKLLRAAFGEIE